MPWAKIDDGLHANEKFAAVSLGATGLWTLCLSWTTDKLKDGFVPSAMVSRLGGRDGHDLAVELVEAGLWDEAEGGYRFHDYLDYNPSAHEIASKREALSEARSEAGKRGGRRSAETRSQANVKQNPSKVQANRQQKATPEPVPVPEGYGTGAIRSAVVGPSADTLPPPPSSPNDSEQKLPTADPDAMRLYEAFRSVRFPRSIPTDWQPGEWLKDLPNLRQMARRGISPSQVIERTERAIARGYPSVTLKAVWSNWGDLGDDLPELPDHVPRRSGRGESIAHAAAALDDDYAALEAAHAQKGLAA